MAVPKNLNLIGPQLQKLRKERRWSQNDLATKVRSMGWHITRDILAQMETTRMRITDCDLIFLSKALDMEVRDFFTAAATPETIRSRINSPRLRLRHPLQTPGDDKTFFPKVAYFIRRIFKKIKSYETQKFSWPSNPQVAEGKRLDN